MTWVQGTARERFNEIQQELSQLSTKFSNNLLDATKAFKKLLKDPAEVCCMHFDPCSSNYVSDGQPCQYKLHGQYQKQLNWVSYLCLGRVL